MDELKYSILGIEMTEEEVDALLQEQGNGKELKVVDGKVVAEYHVSTQEELMRSLRNQRSVLLLAFDKWEKAVLRGRELDEASVMAWYQALLDLKESAFEEIPERVRYYI